MPFMEYYNYIWWGLTLVQVVVIWAFVLLVAKGV